MEWIKAGTEKLLEDNYRRKEKGIHAKLWKDKKRYFRILNTCPQVGEEISYVPSLLVMF